MKTTSTLASFMLILLSTAGEAKTLVLTMKTCFRTAAVAFINKNAHGDVPVYTVQGWFTPRNQVSIDIKESESIFLHVSFWDHGVFAENRFTRDDAAFCVAKIDFEDYFSISSLTLKSNEKCPLGGKLVKLENFQNFATPQETTNIDICEI